MHNKNGNGFFVKKPEFIEISNIYEDLDALVDKYGIEKIILHLGQIANKKISRQYASKIWSLIPETKGSKD
ncbi:MAG: hypothetical protein ACOYMA_00800 [Bacteroidia bacterium]